VGYDDGLFIGGVKEDSDVRLELAPTSLGYFKRRAVDYSDWLGEEELEGEYSKIFARIVG